MQTSTDLRRGRTCVFMMHVHLVFVTKYRRQVFTKEILAELESIFSNVCQRFQSVLVECDGEGDHVHLLVNYPPTCPVSRLVNSLKGVSSRLIRKMNYSSIKKAVWGIKIWLPSYFVCYCGGCFFNFVKIYFSSDLI